MFYYIKISVICLVLLMSQVKIIAQRIIDTTYKNNIVPSPSFTYSPETDIVLGVFALYQYKTKKQNIKPGRLT